MIWIIGVVVYVAIVAVFCKFFAMIKECDADIEQMRSQIERLRDGRD